MVENCWFENRSISVDNKSTAWCLAVSVDDMKIGPFRSRSGLDQFRPPADGILAICGEQRRATNTMSAASGPTASLEQALSHAARLLERDPALAFEQAGEIIRSVGPHPQARLLRALANPGCSRTDEAVIEMRQLAPFPTPIPTGRRE